MEIHSIGYHHMHGDDFLMERPDGIGQGWLFVLIKSKAMMRKGEEIIHIQPDTVLIYSGDMPQYYGADGEDYVDDWFYFTVERLDIELFRELDIPIGVPLRLEDPEELSSIIRTMTYEFYTKSMYSADLVELYMKTLFFKLSRQLHSKVRSVPEGGAPRYDGMIWLREQIYCNIQNVKPVSEMARDMSMSQSAFQHTYKRIFGTNVMTDISNARIQQAQLLLSTTSLPLRQIAERSGYSSEFHLMRHFKSRTGMTPTEYRKKTR